LTFLNKVLLVCLLLGSLTPVSQVYWIIGFSVNLIINIVIIVQCEFLRVVEKVWVVSLVILITIHTMGIHLSLHKRLMCFIKVGGCMVEFNVRVFLSLTWHNCLLRWSNIVRIIRVHRNLLVFLWVDLRNLRITDHNRLMMPLSTGSWSSSFTNRVRILLAAIILRWHYRYIIRQLCIGIGWWLVNRFVAPISRALVLGLLRSYQGVLLEAHVSKLVSVGMGRRINLRSVHKSIRNSSLMTSGDRPSLMAGIVPARELGALSILILSDGR